MRARKFTSPSTWGGPAAACAVYFWARLAYFVVYALGIPVLRTLVWTISWLALLVLVLAIFRIA